MLQANAAYLACLSVGGTISSSSYFPRAKCNGFEAGVGAGYRLADQWEIRAGVDWRRFGLDFHVKTSDVTMDPGSTPAIAGGAIDQYIQINVGIAYVFGGSGSESAHPAESSGGAAKPAKSDGKSEEDGDSDSEGGE
jgi:long-subunit fatty acid transport protein